VTLYLLRIGLFGSWSKKCKLVCIDNTLVRFGLYYIKNKKSEMSAKPIHKRINIDNLILDRENPRLPNYLNCSSDEEILKYMLLEAVTLELMEAIAENDFFEGEQLLVVKEENSDNYIVVEGNRRLSAVLLLNYPERAKVKSKSVKEIQTNAKFIPKELPVLEFKEKKEILRYLGFRHITGIKSWKLLQKARYLCILKESEFPSISIEESCKGLAKRIGSKSDYVRRILVGYEIFKSIEKNDFFHINKLSESSFHFNYLADSLRRESINNYLGIDIKGEHPLDSIRMDKLEILIKWFFEKNAKGLKTIKGDSESLTTLDEILSNPSSTNALEQGSTLEEALSIVRNDGKVIENILETINFNIEKLKSLIDKGITVSDSELSFINSMSTELKNLINTKVVNES